MGNQMWQEFPGVTMIQECVTEKVASERWGRFGHVEKKKERRFQRALKSECKKVTECAGKNKDL